MEMLFRLRPINALNTSSIFQAMWRNHHFRGRCSDLALALYT